MPAERGVARRAGRSGTITEVTLRRRGSRTKVHTGTILHIDPAEDLVIVHLRNRWDATMRATDEVVQAVYGALTP